MKCKANCLKDSRFKPIISC